MSARDDWRAEHWPSDSGRRITAEERAERREACLRAVEELHAERVADWREGRARRYVGVTAQDVAYRLRVSPAARMGNGAVKGSWSGRMPVALRVSPMLRALVKRGELEGRANYDNPSYQWEFWPKGKGRERWIDPTR